MSRRLPRGGLYFLRRINKAESDHERMFVIDVEFAPTRAFMIQVDAASRSLIKALKRIT